MCLLETKIPPVPTVPKELRREDAGQGPAAPVCCCQTIHEGGQAFSLSSVNPHRAKSRAARTTVLVVAMGLAHLTLLVVEDAGQSAAGLLGSSVSRDWAVLAVHPLANQLPWVWDVALSVAMSRWSCVCVCSPVSPGNHCLDVILYQNMLLHFNTHLCARLERTAKNLRLSQVLTITMVELI